MIRLVAAGEHTTILSTLCAECPYSPAGCCTAPPRVDLSDVARIVRLGGRDWLIGEIAAGRLFARGHWLVLRREKKVPRPGGPRVAACVYLGDRGCTLEPDRRAATCNYYVCDQALERGGPEAGRARAAHAELVERFGAWDAALAERVREAFPEGPPWDAAFLDWLGERFAELSRDGTADSAPSTPSSSRTRAPSPG